MTGQSAVGTNVIEIVKDVANVVFFVVVSVITTLSYIQARKTLFAPIRTEIFKFQLKNFEEVILFFQNKSESDFVKVFDFHRIVALNAMRMADSYVSAFFPNQVKINHEERKKLYEQFVGALVSRDYMEKYFEKIEPKIASSPKTNPESGAVISPAATLAKWQKYQHGMVEYTETYERQTKELNRLTASPLLPSRVREHIGCFREIAHTNLKLVGTVITQCAKLMPEHFPGVNDMEEFTTDWIWNEFNGKSMKFEPTSAEILRQINEYLRIEHIMQ